MQEASETNDASIEQPPAAPTPPSDPGSYDPSRVVAFGRLSTKQLNAIAVDFAGRCFVSKELPNDSQLANLLKITRVENQLKQLPKFRVAFWRELSRLSGVSVAELCSKANALPASQEVAEQDKPK